MNNHYPALFVSHGAPDIAITKHAAVDAFVNMGKRYHKPKAIVVVSAHWGADPVGITATEAPATIHDYHGFPQALYNLQYPVRGSRQIADTVKRKLQDAGVDAYLDEQRGLDHGAWMPLLLMYPEADVPVIQVALPAGQIDRCVRLGSALKPLREQGILLVGSGGSVHNLGAISWEQITAPWANAFETWLLETVENGHFERIAAPAEFYPEFSLAHPTSEHYLPLVFAWAAGGRETAGKRIHHSFMYGNIGMSCFEFSG